jgi:predicted transcriptional regulator
MNRKSDDRELTEEERHLLTLEALADVDAGRVVDHAEVRAWVNSLGTATPLPVPRPKT